MRVLHTHLQVFLNLALNLGLDANIFKQMTHRYSCEPVLEFAKLKKRFAKLVQVFSSLRTSTVLPVHINLPTAVVLLSSTNHVHVHVQL